MIDLTLDEIQAVVWAQLVDCPTDKDLLITLKVIADVKHREQKRKHYEGC